MAKAGINFSKAQELKKVRLSPTACILDLPCWKLRAMGTNRESAVEREFFFGGEGGVYWLCCHSCPVTSRNLPMYRVLSLLELLAWLSRRV